MKVSQEKINDLIDYCQDAFDSGKLCRYDQFFSVEKDIKTAFKIKKDFVIQAFEIQAGYAASFKNIPLKCTIREDPESKNHLLYIFENLLTGEIVETSKRLLVNKKLEASDKYEFWVVWLKNPSRREERENSLLAVITRPLEIKKEKEIKLNI